MLKLFLNWEEHWPNFKEKPLELWITFYSLLSIVSAFDCTPRGFGGACRAWAVRRAEARHPKKCHCRETTPCLIFTSMSLIWKVLAQKTPHSQQCLPHLVPRPWIFLRSLPSPEVLGMCSLTSFMVSAPSLEWQLYEDRTFCCTPCCVSSIRNSAWPRKILTW